ncbi:hypothetical protein RJ639_021059, partial [Escallonia herrerae]
GKGIDETGTNADLPFYSLGIIAAATENFSIANKLGEGGFGLVYVTFKVPVNPSIYTRLVLEPMGTLQRRVWHTNSDNIQEWAQFWVAPQDRCDQYQRCGSSAICNSNNIEVECTCLPGFEQDSNQNWYTNCVEKKDLVQQTCGKGSGEGFINFPNLKIPDARVARLFSNLSLQECETECLKSCNCTGYASSDVNNGGRGCFAWHGQLNDLRQYDKDGQDFYLRVAAAELVANTTRNSKGIRGTKKILIITLPIVAAALLLVCCSLYLWRVHARRKDQREKRIHRERVLHDSTTMPNKDFPSANNRGESRHIELKFFDLETIITATDDFSAAKKIGQGGFGPVYKYALDGLFSIKSDVFSFGVLLLEVISGKKNIGFFHNNPTSNLIKHAWELWNDGGALELVDACMGDSYPTRDVLRCIQVGLLCVQDEATDRPDMSTIVFMLSNETTLPSPKQPLFSIQSDSNPRLMTSGSRGSINEMTITMPEGR